MAKYRKKPVVVEAVQWNGCNYDEIDNFIKSTPHHFEQIRTSNTSFGFSTISALVITTLEGDMTAVPGDYIIKGVNGEYYPCKPDIFEKTYEKVEE